MTGIQNYGILCKVASAGDIMCDEEQGEPFFLFQTQQQVEHIQAEIFGIPWFMSTLGANSLLAMAA